MKLAIISIVVLVIAFAFMAETKVTFSPFSITFGDFGRAISWVIILIGIMMLSRFSYIKGIKHATKVLIELSEQQKEQK